MEIKYLIKDTLVATEKNKDFAGETRIYWVGKASRFGGNWTDDESNVQNIASWYGYNTKASAVIGLKRVRENAKWESDRGYWKHTSVEIVAIEV